MDVCVSQYALLSRNGKIKASNSFYTFLLLLLLLFPFAATCKHIGRQAVIEPIPNLYLLCGGVGKTCSNEQMATLYCGKCGLLSHDSLS